MGTTKVACGQTAGNMPTTACTHTQDSLCSNYVRSMFAVQRYIRLQIVWKGRMHHTMSVTPIASNIMMVGTRPARRKSVTISKTLGLLVSLASKQCGGANVIHR